MATAHDAFLFAMKFFLAKKRAGEDQQTHTPLLIRLHNNEGLHFATAIGLS